MSGILKYSIKVADGCVFKYEIPIADIVEVGDGYIETKSHGRTKYLKDEQPNEHELLSLTD